MTPTELTLAVMLVLHIAYTNWKIYTLNLVIGELCIVSLQHCDWFDKLSEGIIKASERFKQERDE